MLGSRYNIAADICHALGTHAEKHDPEECHSEGSRRADAPRGEKKNHAVGLACRGQCRTVEDDLPLARDVAGDVAHVAHVEVVVAAGMWPGNWGNVGHLWSKWNRHFRPCRLHCLFRIRDRRSTCMHASTEFGHRYSRSRRRLGEIAFGRRIRWEVDRDFVARPLQ
eukprot:scaffold121442_cov37-Tisochrysis_lutea.AAC.2